MAFTLEEDYLLGALVVLLIVVIIVAVRHHEKKSGSFTSSSRTGFTVIHPPRAGWDNARGGQVHGGTVPGWGEDYTRPPF